MSAVHLGKWWHRDSTADRIICDLCPRHCSMKDGDRGFCFVRKIEDNQMVLDTYGKSTGFCIDPIEKKPLNHFFPGTSVLSFGTAGCNLGCQFCQNWDISKSREVTKLSSIAEPELIAQAAKELRCKSVAFTYNDPVIWAEYAIDTAKACRKIGIQSVAVTAGYMSPEARRDFYVHMDAANVDLKAFTEEFYRKITYSHLEPVLDTLRYLKHETDVWFEITNLIIPHANDSDDELTRMCDWILNSLGPDVPVHFSAFHPDFRMTDRPSTPTETLFKAYEVAKRAGLHYPYVGNVHDVAHGSTHCFSCSALLIERDWYQLGKYGMLANLCGVCGAKQPGRFSDIPGDWGRKRQPVNLDSFRHSKSSVENNRVSLPIAQSREAMPQVQPQSLTNRSFFSPKEETMPNSSMSAPVKLEMLKLDELSEEQKLAIQRAAQRVVIATVCNRKLTNDWFNGLGDVGELHIMGMFTTLSRGSQLRGCCGFLGRPTKLRDAILSSAQRTAKEDMRMPAISAAELAYLNLDVSILASPIVLTVPAAQRMDHIQIGKHGLRISRGQQAGLLLPSVPVE
ncbi:MAG TPA: AmmeMemoRadiSam system radical SAM enzyme, partial [Pirellula sp.]|nr:AmmeMemoRadiSam system radical SAM enzyme [Pirellula sp.]